MCEKKYCYIEVIAITHIFLTRYDYTYEYEAQYSTVRYCSTIVVLLHRTMFKEHIFCTALYDERVREASSFGSLRQSYPNCTTPPLGRA